MKIALIMVKWTFLSRIDKIFGNFQAFCPNFDASRLFLKKTGDGDFI